jgi:hypothetical protein
MTMGKRVGKMVRIVRMVRIVPEMKFYPRPRSASSDI